MDVLRLYSRSASTLAVIIGCLVAGTASATIATSGTIEYPLSGDAAPYDYNLQVDNGSVTVTAPGPDDYAGVLLGLGGTGTIDVNGGTLNSSEQLTVGGGQQNNGMLTISNGGSVSSGSNFVPPCYHCGVTTYISNGAGSVSTLTVTDPGSSFTVYDPASAVGGEFFVGAGPGSTANFNVLNGATATTSHTDVGFAYYSQTGFANGSIGNATVDGAGSTWTLDGTSALKGSIALGGNGTGNLTVSNGGSINATEIDAGLGVSGSAGTVKVDTGAAVNLMTDTTNNNMANLSVGGSGTVNISGTGSQVTLINSKDYTAIDTSSAATNSSVTFGGPAIVVGSDSTFGDNETLNITNGGTLSIDDTSSAAQGGLFMVGDGTSKVLVAGNGSAINDNSANGLLAVGVEGRGTQHLIIANGGQVNMQSAGSTYVGLTPGANGLIAVSGSGSQLNAGKLLDVGENGANGSVVVKNGGTVNAQNITVQSTGAIGGNGTLNGNVTSNGGAVNVGASPDPLTIHGDFTQNGGTLNFEVDPNGVGGFLESTLVLDMNALINIKNTNIVFNFVSGADPLTFFGDGSFNVDTFFKVANGDQFSSDFALANVFQNDTFSTNSPGVSVTSFNTTSGAITLTQNVPEPATLAVFLVGLAGLGFALRRRAA